MTMSAIFSHARDFLVSAIVFLLVLYCLRSSLPQWAYIGLLALAVLFFLPLPGLASLRKIILALAGLLLPLTLVFLAIKIILFGRKRQKG